MLDSAYREITHRALQLHHGFERLDAGLDDSEIEAIQRRFGFTYPPDLRAVLRFAQPIGRHFPNWRGDSDEQLLVRLNAPLEGILFDVDHNGIWPAECGPPLA